jgi:hypothetical protein
LAGRQFWRASGLILLEDQHFLRRGDERDFLAHTTTLFGLLSSAAQQSSPYIVTPSGETEKGTHESSSNLQRAIVVS